MRLYAAPSLAAIAFSLSGTAPASAQSAVPETENTGAEASQEPTVDLAGDEITPEDDQILVVATRIKGQVDTVQPPIAVLDENAIASYGAGSLQDLLSALAPQTGSGRGRGGGMPVVLLNGMRISGFREMRGLPPEAIRRVEILPEEVALRYGYRPDQRVVNFILKDNFSSLGSDSEVRLPSGGGFTEWEQEFTLTQIAGGNRINFTGKLEDASPLTEAERGIIQPTTSATRVAGDPDPAAYRTLIADTKSAQINATLARALSGGAGLSANILVQRDVSRSLNGLNTVTLSDSSGAYARTLLDPQALTTRRRITTLQAGAAYNKPLGDWFLALTADGGHVETKSTIDQRADLSRLQALVDAGAITASGALPAGAIGLLSPNRALSKTDSLSSLATVSGRPLRLPGGEVSLTVKAGFDYSGIESTDTRTTAGQINLKRGDAQAGFSVDVPITSRKENFGAGVGDISLNANAEVHSLSDFGTLYNWGGGLTYAPTEKLTLQATYVAADKAPGLSDLGGPTIVTENVSVYDFSRNETVLVQVTSGGNPGLVKERQRDWKFGLNWSLPFLKDSTFVAEYFRNRSTNTTNSFPLLTPEVEAAFQTPMRVKRGPDGRIISIDQSPVTFAEEKGSRLRYGLNVSGSFGKPDPAMAQPRGPMAAMRGAGRPGGGGARAGAGGPPDGGPRMGSRGAGGGGRGGPGGFNSDGRGRWNLSVFHTVRFQQSVQIAPGGQVLDLLDGDAISGSVARHSIEMEGGGFYRGFGLRLNGTYTGGSRIDASGLPGSSTLRFDPIATFNLRMFADLGRKEKLVEKVPFFKGSRLSLSVSNLFNAQQRVTDDTGTVPLRYQPGYLDARGRVFEIEFRKQF